MAINKTVLIAATAVFILLMPEVAFAADLGIGFLNKLANLLTTTYARAIGLIMIVIVGYMFFKGRAPWEHACCVIAGIVIILGAASIMDLAMTA